VTRRDLLPETRRAASDPARGSALIIALWTIGLLSMLVVSFAFDAHLEGKAASSARHRREAEYIALSGIPVAEMLLDKQRGVDVEADPADVADDPWHAPAVSLKTGRGFAGLVISNEAFNGTLTLDMEPEPGRRNVNKLSDDDWERILTVAGVPEDYFPELIDSFFDWIDDDSVPRADGAETEDYYEELDPPYRARNAPVDTVRELLLVKGFNEAILSGGVLNPGDPEESWIRISGIQDMLTTYGDGLVNVNAAGARVLQTLPEVDEIVAGAIIEERERGKTGGGEADDTSFTSVGDLTSRIPDLPPFHRLLCGHALRHLPPHGRGARRPRHPARLGHRPSRRQRHADPPLARGALTIPHPRMP
jgi:general secretion pathway protein K